MNRSTWLEKHQTRGVYSEALQWAFKGCKPTFPRNMEIKAWVQLPLFPKADAFHLHTLRKLYVIATAAFSDKRVVELCTGTTHTGVGMIKPNTPGFWFRIWYDYLDITVDPLMGVVVTYVIDLCSKLHDFEFELDIEVLRTDRYELQRTGNYWVDPIGQQMNTLDAIRAFLYLNSEYQVRVSREDTKFKDLYLDFGLDK